MHTVFSDDWVDAYGILHELETDQQMFGKRHSPCKTNLSAYIGPTSYNVSVIS